MTSHESKTSLKLPRLRKCAKSIKRDVHVHEYGIYRFVIKDDALGNHEPCFISKEG